METGDGDGEGRGERAIGEIWGGIWNRRRVEAYGYVYIEIYDTQNENNSPIRSLYS